VKRIHFVLLCVAVFAMIGLGGLYWWMIGSRRASLVVEDSFGNYSDSESIHGFGVLAQLLRQQGHQVARTKMLTRQIERYDLLIWTHLGPQLPSNEALDILDEWMAKGGSVVFIGHDYSAQLDYWRQVYAESQGADRELARWAYRHAQLETLTDRVVDPLAEIWPSSRQRGYAPDTSNQWMNAAGDSQPKTGYWEPVVDGSPWQQIVPKDLATLDIGGEGRSPLTVRTWLTPQGNDARVLATVRVKGEAIPSMWREKWGARTGRSARDLWVISHPMFLGNFGILQPENAVIRDAFLTEISDKNRVLFVDTGPGPVLLSTTPDDRIDQPWAWMTKGPFPIFALHAVVLAVVFCFARFPVFGRPRRIEFEPRNDFGQHVAEVGRLLRARQLEAFAREKLEHYYQIARRNTRKQKPS
jgi:hypothetical protein